MLFYDKFGIAISLQEYSELATDLIYKRIARSKIIESGDPSISFDVSTVWLGVNHNFGDGPPLIFETMVFAEGSSLDLNMDRYATEQAAREGHTAMIVEVCAELTDPIVMDAE